MVSNTALPTVNGVAISTAYQMAGLEKLGHEVHLFCPAPKGYDRRRDPPNIHRFPSIPAPHGLDYRLAIPGGLGVIKALGGLRFDIVHTQHLLWVSDWAWWYAVIHDLPIVCTSHTMLDLYSKDVPLLPKSFLDPRIWRRAATFCNLCDAVTTPSTIMKQKLQGLGVQTPIEVIVNPIDVSRFRQASGAKVRKWAGCAEGDILIGYVGRVSEEKNLDLLLDAAALILPEYPNVKFLIAGSGESQAALEKRVAEMGYRQRILFAGRVEPGNVPQFDAAIDIFASPSLFEVQPLSYAEAMACGKPVVTMNSGGGRYMVRDGINGRLVSEDGKGHDIARVLTELILDPDQRYMLGEQASRWAERYDISAVTEKNLELYHRLYNSYARFRQAS